MPETFGAITLPQAEPSPGEGLDPGLYRFAQYLRAVVNSKLGAAWRAVAPNSEPVKNAFTHSPEEIDFNEKDLPALYLVRQASEGAGWEWLAEDMDLEHTRVRLLWIFPPTRQEFQRQRNDFVNGLNKVIISAIETGRDPSYVLAGDPDPTAAAEGTVIMRAAGFHALHWRGYKTSPGVAIKMAPPAEPRTYYCLDAQLHLVELRTIDLADYAPSQEAPLAPGQGGAGLDLTVTTPDKARDLAVAKT